MEAEWSWSDGRRRFPVVSRRRIHAGRLSVGMDEVRKELFGGLSMNEPTAGEMLERLRAEIEVIGRYIEQIAGRPDEVERSRSKRARRARDAAKLLHPGER